MAERQTRRHLTVREAELALGRGKDVEILLGRCGTQARPGVRFAVLSGAPISVRVAVFEMLTDGAESLDLYEFAPLAEDADSEGVVAEFEAISVAHALVRLESTFPDHSYCMVNFGVVADEYRDLLDSERGR
jgi:hypothetical protein